MINLNSDISSVSPNINHDNIGAAKINKPGADGAGFANTVKAVENYLSKVDGMQHSSDVAIKDLMAGKNQDITSVVSAMAKADMSFKLLVGVRNKLIEAYKQTMNMSV